jgi:hypothetical protein
MEQHQAIFSLAVGFPLAGDRPNNKDGKQQAGAPCQIMGIEDIQEPIKDAENEPSGVEQGGDAQPDKEDSFLVHWQIRSRISGWYHSGSRDSASRHIMCGYNPIGGADRCVARRRIQRLLQLGWTLFI